MILSIGFDSMPRSTEAKAANATINVELPKSYSYRLGLLHVELDRTRKDVITEAFDDLFRKYEKKGVLKPSAADLATRTLQGDKP